MKKMKKRIILILITATPLFIVILDAQLDTRIIDSLKWQWVQLTGTPEDQMQYLLSSLNRRQVKKARPINVLPDWTYYAPFLSQCPPENSGPLTLDEWVKLDAGAIFWCWYREVLSEYPSLYIEFFDDYAPNQYHVNKRVFEGVMRKISSGNREKILGSVIIGPYGSLWTYQTFVCQSEGDHVLAIRTIIAHARFRFKASTRLTYKEYNNLMKNLRILTNNAGDFYANHLNINKNRKDVVFDDWNYQALICGWDEYKSKCQPLLYEESNMVHGYELKLFKEKSIKTLNRLLIDELNWTILYYLPP